MTSTDINVNNVNTMNSMNKETKARHEKNSQTVHAGPIDLERINGRGFDFHSANSDYTGSTMINKNHEIVNYRNSSTVRIWYNEQMAIFPLHWHNSLEIILPVNDCYYAATDETTHCIQTGEIFFIPPGVLHSVYPPPDSIGVRFVYLFDLSVMAHLKDYAGIQPLLCTPFLLNKDNAPELYTDIFDLLMQMQIEYFRRNLYSELIVYSLLMTMFARLGASYADRLATADIQAGRQREYAKQFNDLLAYIDEHYMNPLTLEDMASLMGFSKFHFSRLFKDYTGYTFCDYLNYRRIKATEELLPHAELPITEIAMRVGFSSISTFNRLFRIYKKCSPSEYRSKLSVHTFGKT